MSVDLDDLRQWVGKREVREDRITAAPMAALAATLDREDPQPKPGDILPPLWHWLYLLAAPRHSEIGPDGHPDGGGFLPPKPLPRRMWAGSRLKFLAPLRVGDTVTRTSWVADLNYKEGRSGPLVFVGARHEIKSGEVVCVSEEQDIVFRNPPRPNESKPAAQAAPANPDWAREIRADPVMLFRYSALTFNGHRIHFDRPYAMETEGYPGLVVHGPLIATLLLDLLRRNLPEATVKGFAFRAVRPLFDTAPFSVCGRIEEAGKSVRLWAQDEPGALAMDATAEMA